VLIEWRRRFRKFERCWSDCGKVNKARMVGKCERESLTFDRSGLSKGRSVKIPGPESRSISLKTRWLLARLTWSHSRSGHLLYYLIRPFSHLLALLFPRAPFPNVTFMVQEVRLDSMNDKCFLLLPFCKLCALSPISG